METRFEFEKRVRWIKVKNFDSKILKVYYKKAIQYGAYIDVYEYPKVKITRNATREDYAKGQGKSDNLFSISRARQTVYRLCEANVRAYGGYKPIFVTLTFAKQTHNLDEVIEDWKYFCKKYRRYFSQSLKYVVVPELHQSDAWHLHAVFFNFPYTPLKIFKKIWPHGYVDLQVVRGVKDTSAYIAKYITKDIRLLGHFGRKSYLASRGLIRPVENFDFIAIQDMLSDGIVKRVDYSTGKIYTYSKYKKVCTKK